MVIYEDNEQLKKELKKIIIDSGLSQKEVALKMGCKPQQYTNIVNKANLAFKDVRRIANAIGLDLCISFAPARASGIDPEREADEYKTPEPESERPFTIPPVAGERTPKEEAAALEALQKQINQKIATQKAELTAEEERKRDRTLLTCVPDEVYEKAKEKINNCN